MRHIGTLLTVGIALLMGLAVTAQEQRAGNRSGVMSSTGGWELVWAEEFDKAGPPDPRNWRFENGFVRNEELQWYQPENARCENGLLVIEGRRERKRNPNYVPGSENWRTNREYAEYTSASLQTRGLHQFQYGRFEMRARIDTRPGLWPAFWTLGVAGEWPSCGEVDIMEYYRGALLANVAWGTERRWVGKWSAVKKPFSDFNDPDWSKRFHVWRMDWDENEIRLYVDDLLLNTTSLKETVNPDGKNPFRQPHYLLLNLAIGGQNGGDPSKTEFPSRYEIDYVRVYQKQPQRAAQTSRLWGKQGELWSPTSRLPDFSQAGYRRGEKPLPDAPRAASVTDFGAKGDGMTDDTAAFQKALATVERGAIEVPPGRYRITDLLEITRPNVVLRGAGPDNTILVFPKTLTDVKPNWGATTEGRRTSNYSWSGGFVTLRGSYQEKTLATVTAPATRGDNQVTVSTPAPFRAGQSVLIRVSDTPENTLARHLYSDDPGPIENLKGSTTATLVCRVTRVEGSRLFLDRPLRFDIRAEWKPEVRSFEPTVTESGVENLGFEFPVTDYEGHFTELGYNPVALTSVAHCWVRNIRIRNADSGPMVSGYFNTLQNVVYESARRPDSGGNQGHHGVILGGGDNLFTDFDIRLRFIHDITVSRTAGNVVSRGKGVDLSLDHHRRAPYENLFTDLDAGAGTRLWRSGGGAALGKHSAARGTFWNIRAARPLVYPPATFGPPSLNLVGLHTEQPPVTEPDGKWFETITPNDLVPQNLHEAQRTRRKQQEAR